LTEKKKDQAGKTAPQSPKQKAPEEKTSSRMPEPWALAISVLGMLALGVLIGSVTKHYSRNAGFATVLLESAAPAAEEAPVATGGGGEVPEVEAERGETAAATPSALAPEAPSVEEPLPSAPEPEAPPVEEELPTGLPEVKHVFVIMLKEGSFEAVPDDALQQQGELLTNYYAVTKGALANQIALLSGQGPTPETAVNCPNYGDVAPDIESSEGQVEGNGCVYPAATETLPGQLSEKGLKWKAYVQGTESGAATGLPASCRHPAIGTPDPNQAPTPEDPYATWRNPFLYFHSVIDAPECTETTVGLPQLSADLKRKAEKFPALAYIAPDEAQLEPLVAEIKKSLAYKDGGMIAITSAQAPQEGEKPDESGCCVDPDFPNLPDTGTAAAPTGPVRETGGGGRVGLLLLSPYVEPGTTSETYFNHFSLLVTIEELFELERIGYAAEPAITGFDESIFNAAG
jgi:phosphatidylinositol-3-phosphatase